jgi:dethiobiotin synthetase
MSHQTKENVLFISGIDTNVGKTVATGMIAKALAKAGKKVITQKMIQTGCEHVSEDIEAHRQIQGIPFTDEDTRGLTCPYIFTYPCSPHMAAAKDGRPGQGRGALIFAPPHPASCPARPWPGGVFHAQGLRDG